MSVQSSFGASGEVVVDIKVNVEPALIDVNRLQENFAKLEQIILRSLVLTRRMGLPDDVSQAISSIQRMVSITRQLQLALTALNATPAGLVLGGIGLSMTAFSYADTLGYDSRG